MKPAETEHISPPGDSNLWCLSFCDTDLPKGKQFLGVIITDAAYLTDASTKTHALGINPGGQVRCTGPIPAEWIEQIYWNRLLTREEAWSIPKIERT